MKSDTGEPVYDINKQISQALKEALNNAIELIGHQQKMPVES